jgi:hypothetical protein
LGEHVGDVRAAARVAHQRNALRLQLLIQERATVLVLVDQRRMQRDPVEDLQRKLIDRRIGHHGDEAVRGELVADLDVVAAGGAGAGQEDDARIRRLARAQRRIEALHGGGIDHTSGEQRRAGAAIGHQHVPHPHGVQSLGRNPAAEYEGGEEEEAHTRNVGEAQFASNEAFVRIRDAVQGSEIKTQ